MVALKKYDRIESAGLWRPSPDAQRRDVIAVLGDSTLTIQTSTEQPLAHWSIAAIDRANPGEVPARFHPDGDPGEELELDETETDMVAAIETLRRAVDKARPHPGRLRWLGFTASAAAVIAAAVLWLPGVMVDHTLSVVPQVGRTDIGQALMTRIQRVTGPACGSSANNSSLARLGSRLGAPRLAVMRGGIDTALHLPGGQILLARQLFEDHEEPDVAAGFILAEQTLARQHDPLRAVLEHGGAIATFRLLTTGKLSDDTLDSYAEDLLARPRPEPDRDRLIAAFAAADLRSTPYAYARDITGESVLELIEADPMRGEPVDPLLGDADWLRLQSICGS